MNRRRADLLDEPLPEGAEKAAAVRAMFDRIAPRYDVVNRVMTLRMDLRWRRRLVAGLDLPPGATVLDLACGTGDLCRELAEAAFVPIGVDVSWGMLSRARTTAPLVHSDALDLPVPDGAADGVTCGFALRNVVDLAAFLAECARVTRPGGRLGLLEVDEPVHPLVRRGHAAYFGRVVPWVGARLSDPAAYRYLPRSAAYLPPRDELLGMVGAAGFADVEHHQLLLGAAQLVLATRAAPGPSVTGAQVP